jgi:mRNA interferase RelE/StbE
MVNYESEILKKIAKRRIPEDIWIHFSDIFMTLDLTRNLRIFDVKQLKMPKYTGRTYYRLRKGNYRAIFHMQDDGIYVVALGKREEVYKRWL